MKKLLLILACTLAIPISYGRDTGFAIECTPSNNGLKQILAFFEIGIDKRVRYLEAGTQTMWDNHEWENGYVTVSSFIQTKGNTEASLISFTKIELETMIGEFVSMSDSSNTISMQCQRWSPQTRNK
ncbi:MAG: hypothetical protein COB20_04745 [SAR86 cluster bacterium]|uniref:Uncharacterized protein n=1 Tax=SAR86 cluster bacterium TaxID=2030880 RepID=A0A2A4XBA4_9GAMM|nr:MAG: hypothetical protein COB20_04745 [SAR86 cluster bacterium]